MRFWFLVPTVFAVLCSACGGAESTGIETKKQFVLGGEPSNNESVVLVRSKGPKSTSLCTGTVIAPNMVLTARHCVSGFTEGDYTCTIDGDIDLSRTRVPANAGDMGLPYDGTAIEVHIGRVPDYVTATTTGRTIIAPETNSICRNDIAFVILQDALDVPVMPVRFDSGIVPLETMMIVGYGQNEEKRTERKELGGLDVLDVGPSDFHEVKGNALPRTFVLGRSGCPGDSGGPALSEQSGELIGVLSFSRGDCSSTEVRNFVSQAAPYASLAKQAFNEAGYPDLFSVGPASEPGLGGAPPNEPDLEEDDGAPAEASAGKSGCTIAQHPTPGRPFGFASTLLLFWIWTWRRRRGTAASASYRTSQ